MTGSRTEGSYAYEAPGEAHTLVVDPHVEEMITLFQVNGAMIYVDPDGRSTGYDDVFTRLDKCRAHYAKNGLGADYVGPVHSLNWGHCRRRFALKRAGRRRSGGALAFAGASLRRLAILTDMDQGDARRSLALAGAVLTPTRQSAAACPAGRTFLRS